MRSLSEDGGLLLGAVAEELETTSLRDVEDSLLPDLAGGVEEVPVLDDEGRIFPSFGSHLLQVDLALAWES